MSFPDTPDMSTEELFRRYVYWRLHRARRKFAARAGWLCGMLAVFPLSCRFGGSSLDPTLLAFDPPTGAQDAGEATVSGGSAGAHSPDGQAGEGASDASGGTGNANDDGSSSDAPSDDGTSCEPPLLVPGCDPVTNFGCLLPLSHCDVDPLLPPTPAGVCVFPVAPEGGTCVVAPLSSNCEPKSTCVGGTCKKLCYCDADCPSGNCCNDNAGGAIGAFKVCSAC